MIGEKMNRLAVVLFAVAVAVQALPQNARPQRHILPMRKTMPPVAGRPQTGHPGDRILGGSSASLGQFPHQALVLVEDFYLCGGTLISTSAVLTVGQCTSQFSTWYVSVGGIASEGYELERLTVVTRAATTHPDFSAETLNNDIGVIFLRVDVKLNSNIGLVNLPSLSQVDNSFEGETVTVSGWGLTEDGYAADILQYTTLEVISNELCDESYPGLIVPSMLCATGADGQNTCGGDSGGPMVVGSQGNYTLIGVISFLPVEGCDIGKPTGHTRVTAFLDWISATAGITIS